MDGHPPVTKSKERLSIGFNRILFSLLNTLRGSGPCNGSSNGGGVERRTAPASAKKEREEAGIFRLEKIWNQRILFFFIFLFSSRVIHLAGLSHRASSPFIISTDAPGLRSRRISHQIDIVDGYTYTYSGVLFCSSIYTHTSERVGSLSSHTHTYSSKYQFSAALHSWMADAFLSYSVYTIHTVLSIYSGMGTFHLTFAGSSYCNSWDLFLFFLSSPSIQDFSFDWTTISRLKLCLYSFRLCFHCNISHQRHQHYIGLYKKVSLWIIIDSCGGDPAVQWICLHVQSIDPHFTLSSPSQRRKWSPYSSHDSHFPIWLLCFAL